MTIFYVAADGQKGCLQQALNEARALVQALEDEALTRELCRDWPSLAAAHKATVGLRPAGEAPPPKPCVVVLNEHEGSLGLAVQESQ